MPLSDAEATEMLGPKCGGCGWRRGWHAPWCSQRNGNRAPDITDANAQDARQTEPHDQSVSQL